MGRARQLPAIPSVTPFKIYYMCQKSFLEDSLSPYNANPRLSDSHVKPQTLPLASRPHEMAFFAVMLATPSGQNRSTPLGVMRGALALGGRWK